jgi:hypothetical protein
VCVCVCVCVCVAQPAQNTHTPQMAQNCSKTMATWQNTHTPLPRYQNLKIEPPHSAVEHGEEVSVCGVYFGML